MRCIVITEVLNEKKTLPKVLSQISKSYKVIVVDDGSSDGTGDVARQQGALVVKHPVNLGQGVAFVTGVKAAVLLDADMIVHLDGDGQHNPEQIPDFVEYLKSHKEIDVVVGYRRLSGNESMPFIRRLFLPLFNRVICWITGYDVTDYLCGFRAYRVSSLKKVMHIFDEYYHGQYNATEMFIGFAEHGIKIAEIPVDSVARQSGKSHKGNIKYGINIIVAVFIALKRWGNNK